MSFNDDDDDSLSVEAAPGLEANPAVRRETIDVNGWAATRHNGASGEVGRVGGIPVLWTPSTKTLWAPFVPLPPPSSEDGAAEGLPLHQLRLSGSSLRVHLCGQTASEELGMPLPIGFSVDGLRIEIAREGPNPL